MDLQENIRLLFCLNEKGEVKANEILKDLLQNPEYIKISFEQLTEELKEEEKHRENEYKEKLEKDRKEKELREKALQEERKQLEERYADYWFMIRQQGFTEDKYNVIEAIFKLSNSSFIGRLNIFNLGVIEGKRAERARRKKAQA